MKKYTLQEKMKKTYIGVFSFMLIITVIIMYLIASRIYWNKSRQLCEQLVSLNLDLLNNQVMEVQNWQEMIAKNETVREAVHYYSSKSSRDYSRELYFQRELDDIFYLFSQNRKISNAYIVDQDGRYIYFYKESPQVDYNMLEQAWYSGLVSEINMDTCYVSEFHGKDYLINNTDGLCVSIIRPVQYEKHYTFSADAYLVCDIALDSIFDSSPEDDSMRFAIVDKNNEIYAGNFAGPVTAALEDIAEEAMGQDLYTKNLREDFFTSSIVLSMKSRMFGWKVIGVKRLNEMKDMAVTLLGVFAAIFTATIIVTAFLSRQVAKSVLQPMELLVEECNRVADGDYEVEFREKRSEEISFLSDTIQKMVNNVVELSGQIIEEERKLSDEKLRVLQHQINPHFLNNVLQTIKALAVTGENDKVSRMTTLLGHILTYSVYQPYESVELGTELKYVKYYIELQNIRYDNRIIFSVDCERTAECVQIPKLTLQPLVENSVNHGLKDNNMLTLNISTDIEKDMICVLISDNGAGIREEELEELKRRLENNQVYDRKSSIGIVNVNERLKRMFGEKSGVGIHSKYPGGTTVVIYIPRGDIRNEGIAGR